MGLFDKLKKSPEAEAKYQAKLAEIRAKREERLGTVLAKQIERQTSQVERQDTIRAKQVENQADRNQGIQTKPQEQPSAFKALRDERKAEKTALADTRGKELGYVAISYVGGYDDQRRYNAKL